LYSKLSNQPDIPPEIKEHARRKENEHYLERQAGKVLNSMKNENKRYSNPLIESTIVFVENTSRINGNLRSGLIKEESDIPQEHMQAAAAALDFAKKNGHPEPADAAVHHLVSVGHPQKKAIDAVRGIEQGYLAKSYASGPASSLDTNSELHKHLNANMK